MARKYNNMKQGLTLLLVDGSETKGEPLSGEHIMKHYGINQWFFSPCKDLCIYWLFGLTWKLVNLSSMWFYLNRTVSLLLYIVLIVKVPEKARSIKR